MKRDLQQIFSHDEVISHSPAMQKIIHSLSAIDDSDRHILLHGERGTGKELLARISHQSGDRKEMHCVFADLPIYEPSDLEAALLGQQRAVNSKQQTQRIGLLQEANGGTLIIRNIDLLPLPVQQRLSKMLGTYNQQSVSGLREIKNQSLNVRVIALNMSDPADAVDRQQLHPELAQLFSEHCYLIPPLRSRREDLQTMANHYLTIFVRRYRKRKVRLSRQAMHAIQAYAWPGNVTELKSAMERGALLCDSDEITPSHIGLGMADGRQLSSQALNLDAYFRYVVLQHQDSLSETDLAARLGISRKALWERRQKMNLPRPQS